MSNRPLPDSARDTHVQRESRPGQPECCPSDGGEQKFSLLDYYRSIRDLYTRGQRD